MSSERTYSCKIMENKLLIIDREYEGGDGENNNGVDEALDGSFLYKSESVNEIF